MQKSKMRQHRVYRIPIIVAVALFAIFLIFRLILPGIIKDITERELSKRLGVSASIKNVSLSLLRGSVTMRGITLDNPQGFSSKPLLFVQKIFINITLPSLFSKEIFIELADVQQLELHIQRNKEGVLNIAPVGKRTKTATPSSPGTAKERSGKGIFLKVLKAQDIHISFEDYSISEPPLLTELANATISLKSLRYPDNTSGSESEFSLDGQLVATNTGSVTIHGIFQLGQAPLKTLVSDFNKKFENIYIPHFNPYIQRYGYIFTSGLLGMAFTGKTLQGQIDGLANVLFEKVKFRETGKKLSTLILGIPIHTIPRLFQDPYGTLKLDLEIKGSVTNPQVAWSKLSEQLLLKALGNAFRAGPSQLRKTLDSILKSAKEGGEEGEIIFEKLKDFFDLKSKLLDPLNVEKKNKGQKTE